MFIYKKILKLSPDNIDALTRLGIIYAGNSDDKKAIKLLEKVRAKDPENGEVLKALIFSYIHSEQYYKALAIASYAMELNPKDPGIQRYMGIICNRLGWYHAADVQFQRSFKLDPTSAETAYNEALLIVLQFPERKSEAKQWYKRAVELGAERDHRLEKQLNY